MQAGYLRKMNTTLEQGQANYALQLGDAVLPVSQWLGRRLRLEFQRDIRCVYCDRVTKKSFNQGFCYPCFKKLARCDSCIVSPEKCHYFEGTCREPEWGERNCLRDHIVYLANSTGAKVGITRGTQVPTRWLDQGAVQAVPVFRVSNRLQSGLVESVFKSHVRDRTSWQALLKGEPDAVDLPALAAELVRTTSKDINQLRDRFGLDAITELAEADVVNIRYPVQRWPEKIKAHNLDKKALVEGELWGVKGQYLILDSGVINIRKYGGYHVTLDVQD